MSGVATVSRLAPAAQVFRDQDGGMLQPLLQMELDLERDTHQSDGSISPAANTIHFMN